MNVGGYDTNVVQPDITIKATLFPAGITLYTVQVNTGNDPTSPLLKNCASSADKFFLLTSADQMVTTFNQTGTSLSNLRVAQ